MDVIANWKELLEGIPSGIKIVAVSKTKPIELIKDLHSAGQVDFGENKVQDLIEKKERLPSSLKWHMIGHLQSNKVKYIAPFVNLVHSVDSLKLLKMIDKEGQKNDRRIDCLLQVHIARESSKYGLTRVQLDQLLKELTLLELNNISIKGLMGMATFTDDRNQIREEFQNLRIIFEDLNRGFFSDQNDFRELSMGMSQDYKIAIDEGSTMLRIGSIIFGPRNY